LLSFVSGEKAQTTGEGLSRIRFINLAGIIFTDAAGGLPFRVCTILNIL